MTKMPFTPDVSALTLEEKASLTSGADFWTTKAVPSASIPSIMLTDGPHGLRKQAGDTDHLGLAASIPATCFPPAVGLGSSFDSDLARRVGVALGIESAAQNVAVLLGPGINIKRSPLCGRNFEYFSEDPLVSGVMGAALVRGIQSQGVGASLKHFAANNQETDRLRVSSEVAPRPLREIYLRGFQRVVQDAQPWTVMCAYNRINGVYASEDPWLLTAVLRDEWGFEGLVVSDWGAVNDRVAGVAAGLDLEMPSSGGRTDAQLVAAVRGGALDESALDAAVQRVVELVARTQINSDETEPDLDAHHALAREAAGRSIVLLRNEEGILPLSPDTSRIAVIGEFADKPRFQGAGSSLINPTRVDTALDAIRVTATGRVDYAPGFSTRGAANGDALRADAVRIAGEAEIAVVFLGLPAEEESEGFDRTHLELPEAQLRLLDEVVAANARTVVVLSNGGVVTLPFRDRVPAILEGWLLGQAGGSATADVLFGRVNPSGRLTETIPLRLVDTPSYGNFPGEFGHVHYGEGILVGYRWFDARDLAVAYPFGHGLSYTEFLYGSAEAEIVDDVVLVRLPVTNSGSRAGREVVQAYVSLPESRVQRPPRALVAFSSVEVAAGTTAEVALEIRRSDLAYWDIRVDDWVVEPGEYRIEVGASSRDIRAAVTVQLVGDENRAPLSRASSLAEVLAVPAAAAELHRVLAEGDRSLLKSADAEMVKLIGSFPLSRLSVLDPALTEQGIERIIAAAA
jgi:beta-glucosidase